MRIVRAEAKRRGLGESGIAEVLEQQTYEQIRRVAGPVANFLRSHILLSAALLGVAIQLPLSVIRPVTVFASAVLVGVVMFTAMWAGLGWLCSPLRRYAPVFWASGACAASGAAFLFVLANVGFSGLPATLSLDALGKYGTSLVLTWALMCLPLWGIVAWRNRYRPIHPPGHCRVCGYNLTGLPKPRCPECGTSFDPS